MSVGERLVELPGCKEPIALSCTRANPATRQQLKEAFDAKYERIGDDYCDFIHISRYARFLEDKSRRETWNETVFRCIDFLCQPRKNWAGEPVGDDLIDDYTFYQLYTSILERRVMPSMRVMQTAGPALDSENMCAYNCSFLAMDSVQSFQEVLYILMCGAGVGFSCEKRYVDKLPSVPATLKKVAKVLTPHDHRSGWAWAVYWFITKLYAGEIWDVDYERLRPEGAKLATMGGRASGPAPLRELMDFILKIFVGAQGRKLTSAEVHHIVCKEGNIVVVGGVRRSAEISLSDLSDREMRDCKSGEWWKNAPHLALANNSAVYEGRPGSLQVFLDEWKALKDSYSGERGIFNRKAASVQAGKTGRRQTEGIEFGVNPCSEIILRSRQCCNLSEVIARATDTYEELAEKVRLATVLGTLQARLTNFGTMLSPEWKQNCDEEALLGVSITGIMDNELLNGTAGTLQLRALLTKANAQLQHLYNIEHESYDVICAYEKSSNWIVQWEVVPFAPDFQVDGAQTRVIEGKLCEPVQSPPAPKIWQRMLAHVLSERAALETKIAEANHAERNSPEFIGRLRSLLAVAQSANITWASKLKIRPSTAITCVKPSGCSRADTLVVTSDGILALEEIGSTAPGSPQWQMMHAKFCVAGERSDAPECTKFFVNQGADIVPTKRITLTSGTVLESTPHHRYRVVTFDGVYQWKRVDELRVGDVLPYEVGSYLRVAPIAYRPLVASVLESGARCEAIIQPAHLDEDLAWLLGLYYGDGSARNKYLCIESRVEKLPSLERAKAIVRDKFGVDGQITGRADEQSRELRFANTHLFDWFSANGLTKRDALHVEIPLIVRGSPVPVLKAFIDGYWSAYGPSGRHRPETRTFYTVSLRMAQQLVMCLRALGQACSMRVVPPTENSRSPSVRYWVRARKAWKGDHQLRSDAAHYRLFQSIGLEKNNFVPDTIVSIEDSACPTFDIEVPAGNAYIANSYVSHNTVSELVNASSGIHPRYAHQYIRRVRLDRKDPTVQFLTKEAPWLHIEAGQTNPQETVVTFYKQAPRHSITRSEWSAIEQLDLWKLYNEHWCEHKPSITVYIGDRDPANNVHEKDSAETKNVKRAARFKADDADWKLVGDWVWANFECISGLAFLPRDNGSYKQAPYEDIGEEAFDAATAATKQIRWPDLGLYEREDRRRAGLENFACTGDRCGV